MRPSRRALSLWLAASLPLPAMLTNAQPLSPSVSEEIIITARKRPERSQSAGLSVTAIDREGIRALDARSLPELTLRSANVELFDDYGGNGLSNWVIRGVGLQDFNPNNTPTAALHIDEIYQSSNVMGGVPLFDVEQVEILKGPQGGLYGRNTSGGAVTVQTRRASLEEQEAYLRVGYGRWQRMDLEGAQNWRLGDNSAWRLAVQRDYSNDGWQRSLSEPGQRHGERDQWNIRSWLLIKPSENLSLNWKVSGGENRSELPLGRSIGLYNSEGGLCDSLLAGRRDDRCLNLAGVAAGMTGNTPEVPLQQSRDGRQVLTQPINRLRNRQAGTTLIADLDLNEHLRLSSLSNIEQFDYRADVDFDGTSLEFGHNLGRSEIQQWSQEFRLSTRDPQRLNWMLGLQFARESFSEGREFRLRDSIVSPLQIGQLAFDQRSDIFSLFAQADYALNEQWRLHSSLRYTEEDKRYRNGRILAPAFPPPFDVQADNLRSDYSLGSRLSGNLGLDWQLSTQTLAYVSVARGFKAGGFFGGFPLNPGAIDPYQEETVNAYEIGLKTQPTAALQLNLAAFHYDYRDVQGYITAVSEVTGTPLEFLANQGDARHQGLEVSAVYALSPQWRLLADIGYLDAQMRRSRALTTNLLGESVPVSGRRPYAPRWSGFLGTEYVQTVKAGLQLALHLNYSYRSEFSGSHSSPADRAVYALPGYGLLNGSVFLTPDDQRWQLSLWARNLGNTRFVPRVVFSSFGDFIDVPGEPRSLGVRGEMRW